jgi:hypothetical protein
MVSTLEMVTMVLGNLTGALGLVMVGVGFLAMPTNRLSLLRITSPGRHGDLAAGSRGPVHRLTND